MWIKLRPFAIGLLAALVAIGFLAQAMARTTSPAIGARVQHSTFVWARHDVSSNSAGGLSHCQRKARDKAKVRRTITGNDFQPPVIEQVRLVEGELRLQISETSVKMPGYSNVLIQKLTRPEQPVLAVATVLDPVGRQSGRLAAFKNGGDPEDDPPTWPSAGDSVRIVVASGAFVDSFGNNSAELVIESVTWPGDNGILLDQTSPRLEEICAEGGTVKLTFSEPVSAAAAANALQVDGGPATWVSQNQGYTLQVQLPAGPHQIQFGTAPLDLARLGFSQVSTQSFATTDQTQAVFMAPFPGEAGASLVGNVYGFQGLPEDSETGFLYVRNRYYDPELGRFITPDPLGYEDGPNMYQFGLNNPIVNRDPTGEAVQVIPCAIAGAAAVGVGWAINNLFFEGDYDRTDAALDFTLGALTCGVGNLVKGTAALAGGTTRAALGRMAAVAGADAALTVGTEATRSFLNGEEISGAQLAMSAGLSLVSSFGVPAIMNRMNPCNCFAAGTPVATETGLRPIEQIKVGDLVWALDEESGTPRLQKVVKVFVNPAKETWDLDVRSEDGSTIETIKVTADHPFWLENQGWVAASSLKPGDRLRTNTDAWLEVSQLRGPPLALPVYNFEIEVDHSYFVGQGYLLVHNTCPVPLRGGILAPLGANQRGAVWNSLKQLKQRLQLRADQFAGADFERATLRALQLLKNTQEYIGKPYAGKDWVATIPDGVTPSAFYEIKDWRYLPFTRQLRTQAEIARELGLQLNIIVSLSNRGVSRQLVQEVKSLGGNIFQFDPRTNAMTVLH